MLKLGGKGMGSIFWLDCIRRGGGYLYIGWGCCCCIDKMPTKENCTDSSIRRAEIVMMTIHALIEYCMAVLMCLSHARFPSSMTLLLHGQLQFSIFCIEW